MLDQKSSTQEKLTLESERNQYKVKTTISPDNNVFIWFPIIKEQSNIVDPSYKSILVNTNKLKVS